MTQTNLLVQIGIYVPLSQLRSSIFLVSPPRKFSIINSDPPDIYTSFVDNLINFFKSNFTLPYSYNPIALSYLSNKNFLQNISAVQKRGFVL
jgi:hypothetical protein